MSMKNNSTTPSDATIAAEEPTLNICSEVPEHCEMSPLLSSNQRSEIVDCDVIVHGVPMVLRTDLNKLILILNQKLECNLTAKSLRSYRATCKDPNQFTCSYYFTFFTKEQRDDFLAAVEQFRIKRDVKKFLFEDIFDQFKKIDEEEIRVSFKARITKECKEILSAALEAKKRHQLNDVKEQNGIVWVKKYLGSKRTEAISVEQVEYIAALSFSLHSCEIPQGLMNYLNKK